MKYILSIITISFQIFSQNQIKITVYDELNGSLLQYVEVTNIRTQSKKISDIDGTLMIEALEKDSLVVLLNNYEIQSIICDSKNEYNVHLKKNPIYSNEILVSSTRNKLNLQKSTLKKEKIEHSNLGQDITYLIKNTPSVVVQSDAGNGVGYSGIRIRGTDPTRINVTLNGIPLNDSESQGVWWVNMPDLSSSIQNLQIQRGVGSSSKGSGAFGASVNILTTGIQKDFSLALNNSIGSYNTYKNTLIYNSGIVYDNFNIELRLSNITSDGYIDRASSDLKSFHFTSSYFTDKQLLKLNIIQGKEKTYQSWYGVPKNLLKTNRTYNIYTYENQTDNYWQDHYQLFYSYNLAKDLELNFALNYTHGEGYYEEYKDDQSSSDYNLSRWYFDTNLSELDIIRRKWLNNDYYVATSSFTKKYKSSEITVGLLLSHYYGEHYGQIIKAINGATTVNDDIYKYYFNDAQKSVLNFYTKYNSDITKSLSSYIDLQFRKIDYNYIYDNTTIKGSDSPLFFNPKAGLLYSLNPYHTFSASYSIAQKEANRNDYVDSEIGTKPKSERLDDIEIAYSYNKNDILFDLNFYHMDYTNQLILNGRINDVGAYNRENIKESFRTGIELALQYHLNNFEFYTNATFSKNKVNNYAHYLDNYDANWNYIKQIVENHKNSDLAFSPNKIMSIGLSYKFDWMKVAINTKYVDQQYLDNTSNEERKLDSYYVTDLNINASYKNLFNIIPKLSYYLQFNNIFNELYEGNGWVYSYYLDNQLINDISVYPQAPFNFMLGINIEFGQ